MVQKHFLRQLLIYSTFVDPGRVWRGDTHARITNPDTESIAAHRHPHANPGIAADDRDS